MSLEAMIWCDNVVASSPAAKFVLWILCDGAGPFEHSAHEGDLGFPMPPMSEISRRTQLSMSQVEMIVKTLIGGAFILPAGTSEDDGAICYRLNMNRGAS